MYIYVYTHTHIYSNTNTHTLRYLIVFLMKSYFPLKKLCDIYLLKNYTKVRIPQPQLEGEERVMPGSLASQVNEGFGEECMTIFPLIFFFFA